MHTYTRTKDNGQILYVVGYWLAEHWQPLASFPNEAKAAGWASFLNGGSDPSTKTAEQQS